MTLFRVRRGRVTLPTHQVAVWEAGSGPPVVLVHAAWGSGELWEPQMQSVAAAGLRVVAWSRRGHRGSDPGPADDAGTMTGDLVAVLDALGLAQVHLVGTAIGGFAAAAAAIQHPERLLSVTLAASLCGVNDPDFVAETARLVPSELEALPPELRELSAAYRYAHPAGAARWSMLTGRAVERRVLQPPGVEVTRARLAAVRVPALFVAGEADHYMPPARMAALADGVPDARLVVVPAAGHSPAWENPAAFDRALLDHVRAHA
ncbi:alpha/beta fold hydrolase [Nocardioides mangrovi]|uniref:Alpha/beta hydrolase n=1 Tax=Nocardioides mangrovi TaxID=2874580 RepID=A0ABS7UFV2_9ACTN|nr:alpha/beta hydrolase [Nocardioides mangrovi]MBZ5739528.1 alpha/beta hydrolase [Nocardioides mangrovi]